METTASRPACFVCAEEIPIGRVFVTAQVCHWHGDTRSRRYDKTFHRGCFQEFAASGRRPGRATRYELGHFQLDIHVRGVAAAA